MSRRCAFVLGAIALAQLGACSGPQRDEGPARDRQITTAENAAFAAFQDGFYPAAETLFGRAQQRAQLIDDREEVVMSTYHIAVCRLRARRLDAAVTAVEQARAENSGRNPAVDDDLSLLEARCLVLAGRHAEADSAAQRALTGTSLSAERRASWLLVRAECAAANKDLASARRLLNEAPRQSDSRPDRVRVEAMALLLEGNAAAAAARFDDEARLQQQASDHPSMAESLLRAGGAYEGAGDKRLACDRLLRGALSLQGQGRHREAGEALARAAASASAVNDSALAIRIETARAALESAQTPAGR